VRFHPTSSAHRVHGHLKVSSRGPSRDISEGEREGTKIGSDDYSGEREGTKLEGVCSVGTHAVCVKGPVLVEGGYSSADPAAEPHPTVAEWPLWRLANVWFG